MSKFPFQPNYPRYNYLWRGYLLIYKGVDNLILLHRNKLKLIMVLGSYAIIHKQTIIKDKKINTTLFLSIGKRKPKSRAFAFFRFNSNGSS